MSDFIQTIKNLAHDVAEGYLIFGNDMDEAIISLYNDGSIDNVEILKRICEQSNQNVYLSLFNDESTNKADIRFKIADFAHIKDQVQKSENAMKDYLAPPKDFRSLLEIAVTQPEEEKLASFKLAELRESVEYRDAFKGFQSRLEALRTSEQKKAEDAFEKVAIDAKSMVARGESIGDIAKIAARSIQELGLSTHLKIAGAYDIIKKQLIKEGFSVKTGFTKTSSLKINQTSSVLKPVHDLALAIEKIAAFSEMIGNVSEVISNIDSSLVGKNNDD